MHINSEREPQTIDLEIMASLVAKSTLIIGKKWLEDRLEKDRIARKKAQNADHRRRRIRYKAAHELINWHAEYAQWSAAFRANTQQPVNSTALQLASFCSDLIKTESCPGVSSIISRLKQPAEFLSAAFELEVAVGYLNRGWSVEFVQTDKERSPDLRVITDCGESFWVECKRKEEQSQRDESNAAFFGTLQDALHRVWGPAQTNIGVIIKTSDDPGNHELDPLKDAILWGAEQLRLHPDRINTAFNCKGLFEKYSFQLKFLAEPGQTFESLDFSAPPEDDFEVGATFQLVDGKPTFRNPRYFTFSSDKPSDKYMTALNAFKSATGQLPESGPGVIWIRLAHPRNSAKAHSELEKLASKLKSQLSANQNTRVNAVILSSRVFERNAEGEDLSFRHASAAIVHDAPRTVLSGQMPNKGDSK